MLRGYVCALLSVAFWGVAFVSTKEVLNELSIYTLMMSRFAIGTIFLFLMLLFLREKILVKRKHLPYLCLLALIGVFAHQYLQTTAIQFSNASDAGWIITFSPIFTAIISALFLQEAFNRVALTGMVTSIVGVLLLTSSSLFRDTDANVMWGNLLMIGVTFNWAIYSIALKKCQLPYSSLTITFYTTAIGFIFVFPLSVTEDHMQELGLLSSTGWLHLAFIGICVSALGYWFWAKALTLLTATRVSVFLYLQPVATLLAAYMITDEQLNVMNVVGGILIILGVSIVNNQVKGLKKLHDQRT